jgi:hypothetical protein
VIDRRENVMLQIIYYYSRDHSYNRAIFTVVAGHRKSIIKKIEKHKIQELKELNWIVYNS